MPTIVTDNAYAGGQRIRSLLYSFMRIFGRVSAANYRNSATEPDMEANNELRNRGARGQPIESVIGSDASSAATNGLHTPDTESESPQIEDSSGGPPWRRISSIFSSESMSEQQAENLRARELLYKQCGGRKVSDYARGLPQIAAFQSTDDNVRIARRWDYLHFRIFLKYQIELQRLGEELDVRDHEDALDKNRKGRILGTKYNEEMEPGKEDLLSVIERTLDAYDKFVLNYANIAALGKPQRRNHKSFFDWVLNSSYISKKSRQFIFDDSDFMCLVLDKSNYFEKLAQRFFTYSPSSPFKRFVETREDINLMNQNQEFSHVKYFAKDSTTNFVRGIMVFIAVGIMLMPVYLLLLIQMPRWMMVLIASIFLLLFSILLSATGAKLDKVFIGSATYGGILVVFLGNMNLASGSSA